MDRGQREIDRQTDRQIDKEPETMYTAASISICVVLDAGTTPVFTAFSLYFSSFSRSEEEEEAGSAFRSKLSLKVTRVTFDVAACYFACTMDFSRDGDKVSVDLFFLEGKSYWMLLLLVNNGTMISFFSIVKYKQ